VVVRHRSTGNEGRGRGVRCRLRRERRKCCRQFCPAEARGRRCSVARGAQVAGRYHNGSRTGWGMCAVRVVGLPQQSPVANNKKRHGTAPRRGMANGIVEMCGIHARQTGRQPEPNTGIMIENQRGRSSRPSPRQVNVGSSRQCGGKGVVPRFMVWQGGRVMSGFQITVCRQWL